MWSKIKFVRYGHGFDGPIMYVIVMNHLQGSWKVEVSPCDTCGSPVSDPVAWDIFPDWWSARKYMRKMYKEYYAYVNHN